MQSKQISRVVLWSSLSIVILAFVAGIGMSIYLGKLGGSAYSGKVEAGIYYLRDAYGNFSIIDQKTWMDILRLERGAGIMGAAGIVGLVVLVVGYGIPAIIRRSTGT